MSKKQFYLICAIFFLLILARFLYSYLFTSFGQDVARDLLLVQNQSAKQEYLVAYGPKASVWNFYLPPFYYQIHLLVNLLSSNPLAMKWTTTLVESITPLLLFFLFKKIVRFELALVGAFIYTVSPVILGSSVNAWNPNMIPFFSTLSLWFWIAYLWDQKKLGISGALLTTTLAIQLHYQAVVLLLFPIFVLSFDIVKKKKTWRYWLYGISLALFSMFPYIYFEAGHGWQNTQEIIRYFQLEHSHYYDQISKPAYVFNFIPGFFERISLAEYSPYMIVGRLVWFGGFLVLLGLAYKQKKYRWLLLYFTCILIMLRVYKGDKLDYYLSTLYIFPAILLVLLFKKIQLLGLVLSLVIIGFSFSSLYKAKPYNDLGKLEQQMLVLNRHPQKQLRYLVYNSEDINLLAYGLKTFTDFTYDSKSQEVLEVCSNPQWCKWNGIRQCVHDRGYTYASLLKASADVKQQLPMSGDEYVFSQFTTPIPKVGYRLYLYQNEYGTDVILPGVSQW